MHFYRQEASVDDISTITRMLPSSSRHAEAFDSDFHLNEFIPKPWGHEYRIFCDAVYDIWKLRIDPGHHTSLHCHLNKDTALLCLGGSGEIRFLGGKRQLIQIGSTTYIRRGVFHTTHAMDTPLHLIEVENPRDKFDLLRLEDSYGRVETGYETSWLDCGDLEPLARVSHSCAGARQSDIERAHTYTYQPLSAADLLDDNLLFIVLVGVEQHLSGEIKAIRRADPAATAYLGHDALIIRQNAGQLAPNV